MARHAPLPELPQRFRDRLPELVGDLRQLASVSRLTLADGPDVGQQLIAVSTGSGLDFQLKEAGSLDIRSLHLRGVPVGWRHPAGDTGNPQHALTGFLVTCGLENVRAPRAGLPQHGSLALSPVRLLATGEDWQAPRPELFVEGEITQALPDGSVCRILRRISAPIGGTCFRIGDRIENVSAVPAEVMLLYHINFGFPVVAPGCRVRLGQTLLMKVPDLDAHPAPDLPQCHKMPTDSEIVLERPAAGGWPGLRLALSLDSESLPFLQTWRDARAHRNILALEPCNCDLRADGTSAPGKRLAPGETLQSGLVFAFT